MPSRDLTSRALVLDVLLETVFVSGSEQPEGAVKTMATHRTIKQLCFMLQPLDTFTYPEPEPTVVSETLACCLNILPGLIPLGTQYYTESL